MKTLIVSIMAILLPSASATIINIPNDYTTIQAGINAGTDGDTVLVQPGTYVENININSKEITLASLFLITNDSSFISSTIIDGDSVSQVLNLWYMEDTSSSVTGFTIQNGYNRTTGAGIYCLNCNLKINFNIIKNNVIGLPNENSYGSGIACYFSNVHIFGNRITDNKTIGGSFGGGIYCEAGNVAIEDNFISGNDAQYGGGIHIDSSNGQIIYNTFAENSAHQGGALSISYSDIMIAKNLVSNNFAFNAGGGVFFNRSNSNFSGNVVAYNEVIATGGGLVIHIGNPWILNNVIYHNDATFRAGGIMTYDNSNALVTNNIIRGNTAESDPQINNGGPLDLRYCNIQGGWPGEGNINTNPLFRDPDSSDFHLMAIACGDPFDSPCIDMGAPTIIDTLLDCDWGLGTERSDMGAYGGGDGFVGIDEPSEYLPAKVSLSQNYPNPFNMSTMIKYELPTHSRVTIDIYDVLGRKVSTLEDAVRPAGYHELIWNAEGLSSGVYFYKLQAGDYIKTRKMMLIK